LAIGARRVRYAITRQIWLAAGQDGEAVVDGRKLPKKSPQERDEVEDILEIRGERTDRSQRIV
jgi:hypothetical protein